MIVTLLAGVAGMVGVGPLAASPARAAGYCNIYPPGRIAIWGGSTAVTVRFGEGCARSGSGGGSWFAPLTPVDATVEGRGVRAYWHRGDPFSKAFRIGDGTRPGEVQWSAGRPVYGPVPEHNEPWSTVKLGSVSYVSSTRSGAYHLVLIRAYHYSPTAGRIVASGNRVGQLQYRTTDSAVWRPVTGVRLAADGRAVVRTWSPATRIYRVSFAEQPTLFDTVSAPVSAR